MKKAAALLIFLTLALFVATPVFASPPPHAQLHFDSSDELIQWINEADLKEIDSHTYRKESKYHFTPFIEQLRADKAILIPKYDGQSFPISDEYGFINIAPNNPYEQRYYGFHAKVNNKYFVIAINRIPDEYLDLAKTNYDKYTRKYTPNIFAKRYDVGGAHLIFDCYDVIIRSRRRGKIDKDFVAKLSFEKISLEDGSVLSEYASDGYRIVSRFEYFLKRYGIVILIIAGVVFLAIYNKKRKRALIN